MAHSPEVITKIAALRRAVASCRSAHATVALVPTMGALHEGHLSLVRLAQRHADRVIVSIFVNPAQFAPHEDFASYPRTFEADLTALAQIKADIVWMPSDDQMYPQDFATAIVPSGPAAVGLEDAFRPHFFRGVATVVTKLLLQCLPDIAVFGEKDFQQLRVVTQMAKDLDIPTKIVGAPTERESDGLAMSSRNHYLLPQERAVAPILYQELRRCAGLIAAGQPIDSVLVSGREAMTQAGFVLDYLEARDALTLKPAADASAALRLLVAATLGNTRLIDNTAV
jgi:pantoate--beta-alanine ligase